jgi:hypothetical protein
MKATEIITKDSEKKGLEPGKVLEALSQLIKKNKVILFRENKSVLVLVMLDPNDYESHLFSMDTPLKLSQSMLKFFGYIKRLDGINRIYGAADSPQIINLMKSLAKKEKTEIQMPDREGYNWMISL